MKNLFFASTIFVALIIVLTRQANAQFVVSGSLGLSTTTDKIDGDKQWQTASFKVCPSVGYVFGDWEFGAMFEYTRNKTTLADDRTEKESIYAVGPYANYTFASVGKLVFGAEASALFGFADDEHNIHLKLLPVATYEINDRWDIDVFSDVLSLNYLWTKTDSDKHTNGKFDFLANNGQLFGVAFTFKF